ncbi:hypothetical protein B0H14DRAFT_3643407, partial [Mycena olivaceomarginata]
MSALVAFWVIAVLYGMNVVLFACAVRVLYNRGIIGFNRVIFAVATIQFILATAHNIACLAQLIKGFITDGNIPDGPFLYFLNVGSTEHVLQEGFYVTNSIIGDAILVWRLHMLWKRNWFISSPFIILLAATATCSYIGVSRLANFSPLEPLFLESLAHWILSMWSLSLATQVCATTLIAYRIWVDRLPGMRHPMLVFWMIVESGALYSFTTATTLGLYVQTKNAGAIPGGALGQISALIPTSIIVRVGLDRNSTMASLPSFCATRPFTQDSQGGRFGRDDPALVKISRQVSTPDHTMTGSGSDGKDKMLV